MSEVVYRHPTDGVMVVRYDESGNALVSRAALELLAERAGLAPEATEADLSAEQPAEASGAARASLRRSEGREVAEVDVKGERL